MPLRVCRRDGTLAARARESTDVLRGAGRAVRAQLLLMAPERAPERALMLLDPPPASDPAQKKATMSPAMFPRETFPRTRLPQAKIRRAV